MSEVLIKKEDVSTENIYEYDFDYETGEFSGYWLKFKYVNVPMDTRDPFAPEQDDNAYAVYDCYLFDTDDISTINETYAVDYYYVDKDTYNDLVEEDKMINDYPFLPYEVTDGIMTVNKFYIPDNFNKEDFKPEEPVEPDEPGGDTPGGDDPVEQPLYVTNYTEDSEYYMHNCNGYNENLSALASSDSYNTGFNIPNTITFVGHLDDTIDYNTVSQVGDNDLGYIFISSKYDAVIPFYVKLFANSLDGQTVYKYKIKVSMLSESYTSTYGWLAVGELNTNFDFTQDHEYAFTFGTATYHNDGDNTDTDYMTLSISVDDVQLIGNGMTSANAANMYGKSVMVSQFYYAIEQLTGTTPPSGTLAAAMQTQTDEDAIIPFILYVGLGGSSSIADGIANALGDISALIEANSVKFFREPDTTNNEVIYPSYYKEFGFIDENSVELKYGVYYDADDSYGMQSMGPGFLQYDSNDELDMETGVLICLQAPQSQEPEEPVE